VLGRSRARVADTADRRWLGRALWRPHRHVSAPKSNDVRTRWAEQVGRDGYLILDAVAADSAPAWQRKIPAVQVLATAWEQQYQRDGQEVRWREGKDLPPGRPPAPAARRILPDQHMVDGGYVTAAHVLTSGDEHRVDRTGRIGHPSGRTSPADRVPHRLARQDCDVPPGQDQPQLVHPAQEQRYRTRPRPLRRGRLHRLPRPERACTNAAANGKWGRSLTLLPAAQQQILDTRRREQATDQWQENYHIRAGVEATLSQITQRTGIRRTRYTGKDKTHLDLAA
jgi:hypothetical protein